MQNAEWDAMNKVQHLRQSIRRSSEIMRSAALIMFAALVEAPKPSCFKREMRLSLNRLIYRNVTNYYKTSSP